MTRSVIAAGWSLITQSRAETSVSLLTLPYPLFLSQLSPAGPYPDRMMAMFCEAPSSTLNLGTVHVSGLVSSHQHPSCCTVRKTEEPLAEALGHQGYAARRCATHWSLSSASSLSDYPSVSLSSLLAIRCVITDTGSPRSTTMSARDYTLCSSQVQ